MIGAIEIAIIVLAFVSAKIGWVLFSDWRAAKFAKEAETDA
jgi:hypothetical protein